MVQLSSLAALSCPSDLLPRQQTSGTIYCRVWIAGALPCHYPIARVRASGRLGVIWVGVPEASWFRVLAVPGVHCDCVNIGREREGTSVSLVIWPPQPADWVAAIREAADEV